MAKPKGLNQVAWERGYAKADLIELHDAWWTDLVRPRKPAAAASSTRRRDYFDGFSLKTQETMSFPS
jgi:hypothetical protein